MNKRAFYFWLERLKISPAERKAVSLLLVLFVSLSMINAVLEQNIPYDETYYEEVDRAFEQRAALVQEKKDKILARYEPDVGKPAAVSVVLDTLPADSLDAEENPEDELAGETTPERINVNTATAEVLQSLPGIGPVYARRIVEYREENGDFKSAEELINIKGIGKKRLEKLKPFIKLKGSTEN